MYYIFSSDFRFYKCLISPLSKKMEKVIEKSEI